MEHIVKLEKLVQVCHWINRNGWSPATSGNYSIRENSESCWVSASGVDKGKINPDNFLKMGFDGSYSNEFYKPSDESMLHAKIYELSSNTQCVLHTHSVASTVLSMATSENEIVIEGFEMLKSLTGNKTHEIKQKVKIFDNHQDMDVLRSQLDKTWGNEGGLQFAFILRGHGLYTWGESIHEAKKHVEGLEFLFACMLELRRMGK